MIPLLHNDKLLAENQVLGSKSANANSDKDQ